MREKEFDKFVDQVTERVILQILSGRAVCYECGERPIKERIEKLEQEAEKRRPIVDAVEVVRCEDCRHWVGKHRSQCPVKCKTFGYCDLWEQYVGNGEKFFCAYGERREDDGTD